MTVRTELAAVDTQLDELRTQIDELRERLGASMDGALDPEERAASITREQEIDAIMQALQVRRDDLARRMSAE